MLTASNANQNPRALGGSVYYRIWYEFKKNRWECGSYQKRPSLGVSTKWADKTQGSHESLCSGTGFGISVAYTALNASQYAYLHLRVLSVYKLPYFARLLARWRYPQVSQRYSHLVCNHLVGLHDIASHGRVTSVCHSRVSLVGKQGPTHVSL